MKIYIPSHLKKIKIVEQLCKLIEEYSKQRNNEVENDKKNSTDYFYYYNALEYDPIKKFVGICIYPDGNNLDNIKDKDSIINYLTTLFYTVKGTIKVFDYLKNKLGLDITYTYNITNSELFIQLGEKSYALFEKHEDIYKNSFEKFLKSLLFIKNINIIYNKPKDLSIRSNTDIQLNIDLVSQKYKKINIVYRKEGNK